VVVLVSLSTYFPAYSITCSIAALTLGRIPLAKNTILHSQYSCLLATSSFPSIWFCLSTDLTTYDECERHPPDRYCTHTTHQQLLNHPYILFVAFKQCCSHALRCLNPTVLFSIVLERQNNHVQWWSWRFQLSNLSPLYYQISLLICRLWSSSNFRPSFTLQLLLFPPPSTAWDVPI